MDSKNTTRMIIIAGGIVMWAMILRSSNERIKITSSLAGCYMPVNNDMLHQITLTETGKLQYGNQQIGVAGTLDKGGFSFIPDKKVVIGKNGALNIEEGFPFLLRLNSDKTAFTVFSEDSSPVVFKKSLCLNNIK